MRGLLAPLPPLLNHLNRAIDDASGGSGGGGEGSSSSGGGGAAAAEAAAAGRPEQAERRRNLSVEATKAALAQAVQLFLRGANPDESWIPDKVSYQEQASPEGFFVPYAWAAAESATTPDLRWRATTGR